MDCKNVRNTKPSLITKDSEATTLKYSQGFKKKNLF